MNEQDIKQESAKAVSRNMVGMSNKDAQEYVTGKRSWACVITFACLSIFAGIVAGWVVWVACKGW
jgi:hypothetical protein